MILQYKHDDTVSVCTAWKSDLFISMAIIPSPFLKQKLADKNILLDLLP